MVKLNEWEMGDIMNLNNLYNFKNPIKHFVNINKIEYPSDINTFNILKID